MLKTKAFILAGGKGTRLNSLTKDTPKPLLKLNGKPILEIIINHLKKNGITEILISIGYLGNKIKDYFGDGSDFGVKIEYIKEDPKNPLGTAGPLRLAKDFLTETFVLLYSDNLLDIDIKKVYAFHKKHGGLGTISLVQVEDPSPYGVAVMDEDKIIEFIEKPKKEKAPSNWINIGVSILEPKIIDFIPKREDIVSLEKEVLPKLAKAKKLFGFRFNGYWIDIGTLEKYKRAIEDLRAGRFKN